MFTPQKEVIFSKRYHFEKESDRAQAERVPPTTETEKEKLTAEFNELMRKINEETVYITKPGGEEKGEVFISLAQKLSEDLEIDMDIDRYPGRVSVVLHLFYLPYFLEFTSAFSILLFMCDGMDISPNENEPSDVQITLDLHTHDRYVGGKIIE